MSIQEMLETYSEHNCCIEDLRGYDFTKLPESANITIECDKEFPDYFPLSIIKRDKDTLKVTVTRWLEWEDDLFREFIPQEFANAISQACKRVKGNLSFPISNPDFDLQHGESLFLSWDIYLHSSISHTELKETILENIDVVFSQAKDILKHTEDILILGKDTGSSYDLLKEIEEVLKEEGYSPIIIKDQQEVVGEGVMQKALRYAMNSKFVIVEYTEPAGQLSELPTVVKSAESITAILQEDGKGATWVNEDLFLNHTHVKRFKYTKTELKNKILEALKWAELQRQKKLSITRAAIIGLKGRKVNSLF